MLKRIANIFASTAAQGAGLVVGGRLGNDAYNWVKSGEAKRAAKALVDDAGDALKELTSGSSPDDREARVLREVSTVASLGRAQVECEKCGARAIVELGQGDLVVKCSSCQTRFWVDTDELARVAPPR
jgi:LSD1 subclass zinc finger protein